MKEIKAMLKYLILKEMIEESNGQLSKAGSLMRDAPSEEQYKEAEGFYDALKEHHKALRDASPNVEKIIFGGKLPLVKG